MRTCHVTGCGRPASSQYSKHCNHHRSRVRRQGDPAQRGVTKAALGPYVAMVRERMRANPGSRAWELMDKQWEALVSDARARIAAYQAGAARPWPTIRAAEEVVRLADEVKPREVWVTVAGMVMMAGLDPHSFVSDDAFDTQLVRRVRGLTPSNAPQYLDRAGRTRRAYRELPPRAVKVMAEWMRVAMGPLGQRLTMIELQERRAGEEDKAALNEELMGLK